MARGAGRGAVRSVPGGFVLSGTVATAADAQRIEAIARGFLGEDQRC